MLSPSFFSTQARAHASQAPFQLGAPEARIPQFFSSPGQRPAPRDGVPSASPRRSPQSYFDKFKWQQAHAPPRPEGAAAERPQRGVFSPPQPTSFADEIENKFSTFRARVPGPPAAAGRPFVPRASAQTISALQREQQRLLDIALTGDASAPAPTRRLEAQDLQGTTEPYGAGTAVPSYGFSRGAQDAGAAASAEPRDLSGHSVSVQTGDQISTWKTTSVSTQTLKPFTRSPEPISPSVSPVPKPAAQRKQVTLVAVPQSSLEDPNISLEELARGVTVVHEEQTPPPHSFGTSRTSFSVESEGAPLESRNSKPPAPREDAPAPPAPREDALAPPAPPKSQEIVSSSESPDAHTASLHFGDYTPPALEADGSLSDLELVAKTRTSLLSMRRGFLVTHFPGVAQASVRLFLDDDFTAVRCEPNGAAEPFRIPLAQIASVAAGDDLEGHFTDTFARVRPGTAFSFFLSDGRAFHFASATSLTTRRIVKTLSFLAAHAQPIRRLAGAGALP